MKQSKQWNQFIKTNSAPNSTQILKLLFCAVMKLDIPTHVWGNDFASYGQGVNDEKA